jgi:hypothetical protein
MYKNAPPSGEKIGSLVTGLFEILVKVKLLPPELIAKKGMFRISDIISISMIY